VENDPDDNKFIECAVALKSKVIVTGDQDLIAVQVLYGNWDTDTGAVSKTVFESWVTNDIPRG
jgi:predicted nucleic acid-binding protein